MNINDVEYKILESFVELQLELIEQIKNTNYMHGA